MTTYPPAGLDSTDHVEDHDLATDGCLSEATDLDQTQHTIGTITMSTGEVADLAELLDELDRFLRLGHGVDVLAEFYRTHHHDPSPRFTALGVVDQVGFTALGLRRRVQAASNPGADQ